MIKIQRYWRNWFLLALWCCACTAGSVAVASSVPDRALDSTRLDSVPLDTAHLTRMIENELAVSHIPGAVVLIGQGNRILYRQAFGLRSLIPVRQPMQIDTVFDIASLTKVVATTPAIMQLVEQGKLQLNRPVADYWPDFAAHGKGTMTVQQLLTHTSGLRPDLDLRTAWQGGIQARARMIDETPVARPGMRFIYSDINFMVLAELVQRLSGLPFEQYCQTHIFQPLGMTHTRFLPPASWQKIITPNDIQDGVLRWGQVQDPTAFRMGGVAGHAGVFSTVDDLARFAQMLVAPEHTVLSSSSIRAMQHAYPVPGGVIRGLGWDKHSPYSFQLDSAFGPQSFGHTGYTGTMLWIDPQRQRYVIVLANPLHPAHQGSVLHLRRLVMALAAGI